MNFRYSRCLTTFSVLLSLAFPSLVRAATLNVPSAAYPTIQSGVDAAHDGDTVTVADGFYNGDGNRDIDFHGKSLTVTSQNGPAKTIMDCGGYNSADGSGNHRGFYGGNAEYGLNGTVRGLTIKNGYEKFFSNLPDSGLGGGIYNDHSSGGVFVLDNCIVSANSAEYGGGGIELQNNGKVILVDCTVTGNTAPSGGGGGIDNFNTKTGSSTLDNCTISNNSAQYGSGIQNSNLKGSMITLTNCTVAGNTCQYDGSVLNDNYKGGRISLINCTVTTSNEYGVFNTNDNSGSVVLTNDIVYGNASGEVYTAGSAPTVSFSDIKGGYSGTGNIDADPLFVNAAFSDLHLQAGSPCISKGIASGAQALDKDGRTRPDPPSIGAYELAQKFSVPAQFPTIQSGVDAAHDGDIVLVADGTYSGPGNRDIDFHGKSLTVTTQHGPTKTIIDCGGYKTADGSGNHRGFYIHSGEKNAAISGFTVKKGYENYVSNNFYSGVGGGISIINLNGNIALTNCTIITANTATYDRGGGGGVYNENSDDSVMVTLTNCTITANTAADGGGVLNFFYRKGVITLTNCTITANTATYEGGGIYNYNYNSSGMVSLINCTITTNTAASEGGGIYNYNDNLKGSITLTNDIIYSDSRGEVVNSSYSDPIAIVTYSNVQGGSSGTGNINKDPLFVNAAIGDLHLKPGSPCLGVGTADGAPSTDLDGTPRPNPPSMGAYEMGLVPATITGFTLTPAQINAPGPLVTASVSVTGSFTKVTVAPAPGSLSSASPTFNLMTNSGGGWGGSFPTGFLKLAKTNPVSFIATGTRSDGSTVMMAAALTVGPVVSAPTLALYLSPLAAKVAPDQVVNFKVVVSNITQAPALFTTISVALPDNLDFVASQGFTYDAGKKMLVVTRSLLALPSVAKTFGSNLALLSFSARVRANTPQNSTLVIKSNVTCAGFQSTEQYASLIVGGAVLPNSVRVDASQGLGILGGDVSVNGRSNTPLCATLTPKTSLNNWIMLFGDTRPLTLWLEVQHGNALTPTTSDPLAGFLAQQGLLAPSGSPAYDATFAFIGDTKTITATFGPTAASLTLADMLIEILNLKSKGKGSAPTISQLLGFAEDIKTIVPLGDAVNAFTNPKPMNFGQYGQATAKAAKALVELSVRNSTVSKKLVEAVSNRFDILLDPETFGQLFTIANNIFNLTHTFYDLVAFNVMTQGNPLTVSFVATTQ